MPACRQTNYVDGLKKLTWQLTKLRRGASLWVKVGWTRGLVCQGGTPCDAQRASCCSGHTYLIFLNRVLRVFPSFPTQSKSHRRRHRRRRQWYLGDLPKNALTCLRVLARLGSGYTVEVAALGGFGI